MLQSWAQANNAKVVTVPITSKKGVELWPRMGDFLNYMMAYFEYAGGKSFSRPGFKVVTKEDLGIGGEELISLEESFKAFSIP